MTEQYSPARMSLRMDARLYMLLCILPWQQCLVSSWHPPTHTRKPPTPSLTAAPAVLQEGKKMGQQSSTDLAAENPNSSNNTSTPSTAHTLKRSWDSAHTALTPCISSCSFRHSVYTLESPQACLPAFLHEEMDKTENVPEAGGWGQNTRVPIYWSKCAFIYKATRDREWNWVLPAGREINKHAHTQFYTVLCMR